MYAPRVEIGPEGDFVFRHLPPLYVEALLNVPRILHEDDTRVESRLFPNSYPADEDREADWERFSRPDLRHLFVSRRALISEDLKGVAAEPGYKGFRLVVPQSHRSAWMTGLNAARLALGVKHDVDAEDMEKDLDLEDPDDKELALLQIHLLGHLQGLIVDAEE